MSYGGSTMYGAPTTSPHLIGAYSRDPSRSPQLQPSPQRNQPRTNNQNSNNNNNYSPQHTPNQFALRPTHRNGAYNTFSALPPQQPQFTPSTASASPLRPRSHFFQGSNRANSLPPDDLFASKDDQSLLCKPPTPRRLRHSRSSEILRKLVRGSDKKESKDSQQRYSTFHSQQRYSPLSDEDDDDDERIRHRGLGATPRGVGGASSTIPSAGAMFHAPAPERSSFHSQPERSSSEFHSQPEYSSQESFATANSGQHNNLFATANSGQHNNLQPPARTAPYPAAASPGSKPRPLSDYLPLRASNDVLLAAETGGMIGNEGGTFVQGKGPGEAIGGPRGPRQQRLANRRSMGNLQAPQQPQQLANRRSMGDLQPLQQPVQQQAHQVQRAQQERLQPQIPPPLQSILKPSPEPSPVPSPGPQSAAAAYPPIPVAPKRSMKRPSHQRSHSDGEALSALARQGTLFHPASSQERAAKELDVMLGKPRSRRLSANRLLPAPETPVKEKDQVRLEAAKKGRARIELDVVIERECVVEGGEMRGRLEVVVRGGKRGKGLRVGGGKLRVLGFEETDNGQQRHIFYQHQYPLRQFVDGASADRCTLFTDTPDEEGFRAAKEGTHDMPFAMPLPLDGGAKGSYTCPQGKGPNIRYVVVGSIKLHIPSTGKRAIAHFYRPIVVLPYHNPMDALAPAHSPLVGHTTSGLGWRLGGEKGKVEVQVALGRRNWVAGQRVWCEVSVRNQSHKKINRCTLAILQDVNTFGIAKANAKNKNPPVDVVRTKVAEEEVEADFMEIGSGRVTSKSWWTGLESGESNRWDMSVAIPTGMISIPRSRYVEVVYTLRVTLNNTIYVDVPLKLINFLSIDPPPMPSDRNRRWAPPVAVAPEGAIQPIDHMVSPVQQAPPAMYSQLQTQSRHHARSSSTTLHFDQLLAQSQANAEVRQEDFGPSRPMSPGSVYSTVASTIKAKSESGFSIDEEERNRVAAEWARREGRETSLRVINADDTMLLTDSETDDEDGFERLSPEEQRTYLPSEPPLETELAIGDGDDADADVSESGDTDATPLASPLFSPVAELPLFDIPDFTKHPRDEYLAHISEEEEIDDDMLSEIVSYSGDHGGHLHIQGDFDEDDDMIEEAVTPTMEAADLDAATPTRRSLEDRLATLIAKDRPLPQPTGAPATYAVLPPRPQTIDYAEPIEVDTISLTGLSLSEDCHSDAPTFGRRSPYARPQTVLSYSTASWSTAEEVERDAPRIPSLARARDIRWGGALTGRTVSGRSALLSFSDDDLSTVRAASDSENESGGDYDDDNDLPPPNTHALGREYARSSGHGSFVTAPDEVPALATPENSDSDSLEAPESPPRRVSRLQKPVYASPVGQKRGNLVVPERFKPRVVSDAESHQSFISTTSTNCTATTTDSVLPAVKARVAQIETRNEALRKFSVASSAGLNTSPSTLHAPLSPASGRVSPSGRRSYTSALGGPRSRSPASIHSNTMSERSTVPGSPASGVFGSPASGAFSFDNSPRTDPASLDQHSGQPAAYTGGLDPVALGGTAFARGVTSPTSSLGHHRWDGSEHSHSGVGVGMGNFGNFGFPSSGNAPRSLARANSTCSISTSATDIERALTPSRLLAGPRGPRARQTAVNVSVSPTVGAKPLAFPPVGNVGNVANAAANTPTPTRVTPLFISVKSESASLDGYSSDTYSDSQGHTLGTLSDSYAKEVLVKTLSHTSDGQFSDASEPKSAVSAESAHTNRTSASAGSASGASDWSTGWRGVNLRLPQFKY